MEKTKKKFRLRNGLIKEVAEELGMTESQCKWAWVAKDNRVENAIWKKVKEEAMLKQESEKIKKELGIAEEIC